jgi:pyruvate dehydrogenase E2 component (dihydrolipoamide acetyltransferase)
VSPLADRLAAELGINPHGLVGSGPGGRVLRRDVEAAGGRRTTAAPPPAAAVRSPAAPGPVPPRTESPAVEPGSDTGGVRLEEPSKIRQAIAQYMSEAKQRVPHFYVTAEVDMGELVHLRQALRDSGRFPDLTVTHLLLAALAVTLPKHPRVNASWRDGKLELHDEVNLGVAVGVEDGLLVPVLRSAQRLGLEEIARRTTELTARARQGKFGTEDLRGATFTLSNLGMFDIEEFSAIINPPQAAILAVGAVKERAVVRDGALTVAKTMKATLSCDHRVLNGTEGARFLVDLKGLLQSPLPLVLP